MVRAARLSTLLLFALFLSACQPYLDHGAEPIEWEAAKVDFGTRRSLQKTGHFGDRERLRIEFNQPLHLPESEGDKIPFDIKILPKTGISEIKRVGVSGLEVVFSEKLPPARRYKAEVSAGWRALTGASLLHPIELDWETERPKLIEVNRVEDPLKPDTLRFQLDFNQAVDIESVKATLSAQATGAEQTLTFENWRQVEGQPSIQVSIPGLGPFQSFEMKLAPGLRSLDGGLEGTGGETFLLGAPPKFFFSAERSQKLGPDDPVVLKFSAPVDREELKRHLHGVDWNSAYLLSSDSQSFHLHWVEERILGTRPVHLTLLGDLTSHEGSRLHQDIDILLERPTAQLRSSTQAFRQCQVLKPGQTTFKLLAPKESMVKTWKLSPGQAARLLLLPHDRWRSKMALEMERQKPVYQQELKKAFPATRFLKKEGWSDKNRFGFFLVRVSEKSGKTSRRLVVRTDSSVDQSAINGSVYCHVEGRRSGLARGGAKVLALDENGRPLREVATDATGEASFQGPWFERPVFLQVGWGNDQFLRALQPLQVTAPDLLPGLIWADSPVYGRGERVQFFGLWWSSWTRPDIALVGPDGRSLDMEVTSAAGSGLFFQGELKAPDKAGDYFLQLPVVNNSVPNFPFKVADQIGATDSPSELSLEKDENGVYRGQYRWVGPGGAQLDLRATLRYRDHAPNFWRRVILNQPRWIPLDVKLHQTLQGGNFELGSLPEVFGPWELVVELFDKREPGRVFRRKSVNLGDAALLMESGELKHVSSNQHRARLRFRFRDGQNGPGRRLQCRLLLKKPGEARWESIQSETVTWKESAYEWQTNLQGSGRVRLEVLWTPVDSEIAEVANWERNLAPDFLAGRRPLTLSEEVFNPGRPVGVSWPGLAVGTPVWLEVVSGQGSIFHARRVSGPEGSLGEIDLGPVNPGCRAVVLVATVGDRVRANRVDVIGGTAFLDATLQVNGNLAEEIESAPGQRIQVEPLYQKAGLSRGVLWWEEGEKEDALGAPATLLQRMIDSTKKSSATIHGTPRIPIFGPQELPEGGLIELRAPSQPGRYKLLFLGEDEERTVVFAEQSLKVTESAHWKLVTPPQLRPGDKFSAGVRFWSDPESTGPTGANTTVKLTSTLLPTSYFSTNALVDPGSTGDMLFYYQMPEFIAAGEVNRFRLIWDLGVEGEEHEISATLNPLPTPSKSIVYREGILAEGHGLRLNLKGFEMWKLELSRNDSEGEPSLLTVLGAEKEPVTISLDEGGESHREFYGLGDVKVEIRHQSGGEVRLRLLRLQPTRVRERRQAEGLYVLRHLEDQDGEEVALDRLEMREEYLLTHHLVVPEPLEPATLSVPIPGGLEPQGCWIQDFDKGLTPVGWNREDGLVKIQLPALDVGEKRVLVAVRSVVSGDYLWPASVVTSQSGETAATTLDSRVEIR